MLVLTRRAGEGIVIDGGIQIKVLAIKGRVIRLGIDAPASIRVARSELVDGEGDSVRSPTTVNGSQTVRARPAMS
ncbi:MAG TPA: carbon storage regulator [Gemmataceae bacterium]|nr:carbon storage regulator [Gemmataceae bacterium]